MTSSTVEARAPATWWGHPVVQRHAPVIVIVLVLIALWYIATVLANATLVREAFERAAEGRPADVKLQIDMTKVAA